MITVNTREDFLRQIKSIIPVNPYIAEIGVLDGDFSKSILSILEPDVLVLIDPYTISSESYNNGTPTAYSTEENYGNLKKVFEGEIKAKKIIIDKRYSFNAVDDYENEIFDMVYIDGSHLYADVKRDLNDWLPKLKEGRICSGHDYIQFSDFGVIQAVDEFAKDNNYEMIMFNENGGDWALQKIK